MRLLWNGNEPGNRWDAGPYLRFSATSDNFTLATYNRFRRSITVSMVGARPPRAPQPRAPPWRGSCAPRPVPPGAGTRTLAACAAGSGSASGKPSGG
jgi:hypothetical protein